MRSPVFVESYYVDIICLASNHQRLFWLGGTIRMMDIFLENGRKYVLSHYVCCHSWAYYYSKMHGFLCGIQCIIFDGVMMTWW